MKPYAMTRLDALRQLRREGYAVVRRGCEHEFDPECARCQTLAHFEPAADAAARQDPPPTPPSPVVPRGLDSAPRNPSLGAPVENPGAE